MIISDNFCQFCTKTCCDPSSEPSRSDYGLQHMVSVRNKKNYLLIIIRYPLLSRALADSTGGSNDLSQQKFCGV